MKKIVLVNSFTGDLTKTAELIIKLIATVIPKLSYKKVLLGHNAAANTTWQTFIGETCKKISDQPVSITDEIFDLDSNQFIDAGQVLKMIQNRDQSKKGRLLGNSAESYLLSNFAAEDLRSQIKVAAYKAYTSLERQLDSINNGETIIVFGSSLLITSLLIIAARKFYMDDNDNELAIEETFLSFPSSDLHVYVIENYGTSERTYSGILDTNICLKTLIERQK